MGDRPNGTGSFDDLLVHPGETLLEAMADRGVSQSELARRTGVSEKHVSRVVRGLDGISASFAVALEYALAIPASFWVNLQANYDCERALCEDAAESDEVELSLLRGMPETLAYWAKLGIVDAGAEESEIVRSVRKILRVRSLRYAEDCLEGAAYRASRTRAAQNPCALLAWRRTGELLALEEKCDAVFDKAKLEEAIPRLKEAIAEDPAIFLPKIREILREVGVSFQVVPAFDGVDARGMVLSFADGKPLVVVAARQENAASFWLTLFHELAHLLDGSVPRGGIDYCGGESLAEIKTERKAEDMLIGRKAWREFDDAEEQTEASIERFAQSQGVPAFIVEARLARERKMEIRSTPHIEWAVVGLD